MDEAKNQIWPLTFRVATHPRPPPKSHQQALAPEPVGAVNEPQARYRLRWMGSHCMVQQIIEFCSSDATAFWLVLASDLSIALAYFAIPITMAVVLRDRRDDIPYPWLWLLFVTFIVACGLTHLAHVWSTIMGVGYPKLHALIGALTAAASVATAIAFVLILPQIRDLPSPAQQRIRLQRLVTERTKQKDVLIREIHHRIGNQLQVIHSLINIEERKTEDRVCRDALERIKTEVAKMSDEHRLKSIRDYLDEAERRHINAPAPQVDAVVEFTPGAARPVSN